MSKELEKAATLNKRAKEIVAKAIKSSDNIDELPSAERDNLQQAQALYTEALTQDPTNYELYYNRSMVNDLLGFDSQAYHDFDAAIHYAPEHMKEQLRQKKNTKMLNEPL